MGMSVGGAGGGPRAEINMTPMIDVLLVLIIIFMVITPLAPHGLQAVVPPQSDEAQPAGFVSRDIVVSVAPGGGIELNSQTVELAALGERLAELYARHINDHIFVRGDRGLSFESVAQVIDVARGAGWGRIGLVTR